MPPTSFNRVPARLAIVGAGRLGSALARGLDGSEAFELVAMLGRGDSLAGPHDVVLLCVPDAEIAAVAAAIEPGPLVGHCSGATGLEPLAPHEAFSLHPLMTVTDAGADFTGVTAAIDGTSVRALELAASLTHALAMEAIRVRPEDRVAYHAAASIASNFLVTLQAAAEQLAATAGLERRMLVPLVRATVDNWASRGGAPALTGTVGPSDEVTVARQREAVAERTPELLALFDALMQTTRGLASKRELEHA
jgi:predicted short-subunit dehydrogenase-like oxidoreductase (DUF2520 family)